MATQLDHSVGIGSESTYGTAVTPTRWYDWLADSSVMWDPEPVQGEGLRVGSFVARSARRRAGYGFGELTLRVPLLSKGAGLLLKPALGTGASSTVSGTTYQQVHTVGQSGSTLPSLTIQCGIVDGSGNANPHTFAGCVCQEWSIEVPEDGGPAIFESKWHARSLDTETGLTTVVPPTLTESSPCDFRARDCTAMTIGGTLTAPTSTALASVADETVSGLWRSLKVTCNNNLDIDGAKLMGETRAPTVGQREITIGGGIRFETMDIPEAFAAQTPQCILGEFTGPESLSTGKATLQIVAPVGKLNQGTPSPADGEVVTLDAEWQVLDGLSASAPLYVVLRTADSSL